MAEDGADFAAYVAARWSDLVRTVVLVGCPRSHAEDVVLDGVARCSGDWERVLRTDDPEVHVHRAVVRAWRQRRRLPAEPPPTDEVAELEPLLAGLTPEQREVLVVRALSGLAPDQVADVLDTSEDTARRTVPGAPRDEAVRHAAASVEVLPAPYAHVTERARGQRRRRRRIVLGSVAAGALVLGLATWAGAALSREGVGERPTRPERVLSPASIAWYAEGRLHLREVTVPIPGVTDLVAVGDTMVYLDEDGVVGQVSPDGDVVEVGLALPGAQLLGATDHGWAAWVEPGDPEARLVVWDVAHRVEVGGLPVEESVRPIALDQGLVQFSTASGDYAWDPPDADPYRLPPTGLIDQASATRVFQREQRIEIVQPLFGLSFLRAGEGAQLSFGGRYVLSRAPGSTDARGAWEPLLYDSRTGEAIDPGVAPGERVVAGGFTPLQEVAYLVVTGDEELLLLRTCEPGSGACQDVAPVATGGDPVLLAE
ncbi:SigE family RNA polymerase sigma factor [Nocardioides pyridinolyticus]